MADVIVAGAGPTGLMLACELRLAGVAVEVLDALPSRTSESRAGGLHARTMELLDQRGIVDRFLAGGRHIGSGHFAGLRFDLADLPTRYPFTLGILQGDVERLLEKRLTELGGTVRWGAPVTGVRQDAGGVEVEVGGGRPVSARYLVGCDGGRSTVRRLGGIGFPGTAASMSSMLGDVSLSDPPAEVFQARREHGEYSVLGFQPGWYRVMVNQYDRVADRDAPLTVDDLRAALLRVAGSDFGMHDPRWVSRFSDAARLADRYRSGRVLLAGDAAHIHYPAGGQGLNTGVQDAVNLGWKLAAALRGAPDALLDTYEAERRPVADRVLRNTRAQSALGRPDPQTEALREILDGLISDDPVRHRLAAMITALDIRYPLGDGHPLVGRRLPDVELTVDGATVRAYELLREARPVLLDPTGALAAPPGVYRVPVAAVPATWTVPLVGEVPAPGSVLVRPDGHVAWAGTAQPDLDAALTHLAVLTA